MTAYIYVAMRINLPTQWDTCERIKPFILSTRKNTGSVSLQSARGNELSDQERCRNCGEKGESLSWSFVSWREREVERPAQGCCRLCVRDIEPNIIISDAIIGASTPTGFINNKLSRKCKSIKILSYTYHVLK